MKLIIEIEDYALEQLQDALTVKKEDLNRFAIIPDDKDMHYVRKILWARKILDMKTAAYEQAKA